MVRFWTHFEDRTEKLMKDWVWDEKRGRNKKDSQFCSIDHCLELYYGTSSALGERENRIQNIL